MNKRALVARALLQLRQQTGLVAHVNISQPGSALDRLNASDPNPTIRFQQFDIQVCAQLGSSLEATLNVDGVIDAVYPTLLISELITDDVATQFREAGVNYLDAAGNAFLNIPPVFVLVQGRQPLANAQNRGDSDLFSETGLRIILALLVFENLLNASYRDIAEHADVSMGTVGWVLRDLRLQNFIEQHSGHLSWCNRAGLQQRWVEEYPNLSSKSSLGVFHSRDPLWWQTIDLERYDALLGGEIAAVNYRLGFKPDSGEVFIGKFNADKLVDDLQLVRTTTAQGEYRHRVELHTKFWGRKNSQDLFQHSVHPLIAYASLWDTFDPRVRGVVDALANEFLH